MRIEWELYENYLKGDKEDWSENDKGQVLRHESDELAGIPPCVLRPFIHKKFFRADTDFPITPQIVKKIASIPGVNIIEPTEKYAFIISFGRLFYSEQIMGDIEKELKDGQTNIGLKPSS